MIEVLKRLFRELDLWITRENESRDKEGVFKFRKCEIKLLGQMSLLANERVSAWLDLVGTRDLDADLGNIEHPIKRRMIELLKANRLEYDEDSEKIWLPAGKKFEVLFRFKNLTVSILDPESALVSKAIKAKEKNKQLIQEAIALNKFPNLIDRIEENGGDIEYFLE